MSSSTFGGVEGQMADHLEWAHGIVSPPLAENVWPV
jgi:hypothetical protein